MSKYLNRVYITEIVLFFLIIFGVVPRWFAFVLAGILIIYTLLASLEDATVLFVRSIPLFIALPITANFDNFNTWRIITIILFVKWIIVQYQNANLKIQNDNLKFKILLICLFVISILSILVAQDKMAGVMRVIYFANLAMVPIVIYYVADKRRIIRNFIPPLVIILAIGFFQLATTYFHDIYGFVDLWGWGAQCRQFGMEWCRIAVEKGNTWFAYNSFGNINLRMFSLFTDSHTFPMYILMSLPAVFAYANFPKMRNIAIIIPFAFLAAILSNTRGIWLAGWAVTILAIISLIVIRKTVWRHLVGWLAVFVLMFAFVYPISATPQFHLWAGNSNLKTRIRSIFDPAETSNALRIAIWKASLKSITSHPLLGVGIGNFPVVLQQDIALAKAGSSAHNLYLHIGAELGVPALLCALAFFWLLFKKTWREFRSATGNFEALYFGALLIILPWLYAYLLTDAALFDERAFLMFAAVSATILAVGPLRSGLSGQTAQ